MRFFTAASVAFAALTGFVSAQSATATGAAPVGTMRGNAITHPIATDSITAGSTFDISWTNKVGSTVTLVLVDGPTNQLKPVATIVASVDNTGSYTWTVPDDLPASTTYAIRIQYDNTPANWNYSDRFVFVSDVTATPSMTTASSTTSESSTSTESSTETSTSTESETSTITSETSTTSMSTRTTSRRSTSTSTSEPTETSGAPVNAAGSNVSSPVAIIMAVLAAALFIH